nr:uncharacterized protein LOC127310560 [Lolium perenne]
MAAAPEALPRSSGGPSASSSSPARGQWRQRRSVCVVVVPARGQWRQRRAAPAVGEGSSASPAASTAAAASARRRSAPAISASHLRPARFHAPSERARLPRSVSARTPGGRRIALPALDRPPPLPTGLALVISDGGVVAVAAERRPSARDCSSEAAAGYGGGRGAAGGE